MYTDVRVKFARLLKKLREKKGLSVSQLAKKAGVSRQHVRDLELTYPTKRVTIITIEKLARGLDVPMWALLKF